MTAPAIECEGLGRTYRQRKLTGGGKETVALADLSLCIAPGTVFGLLGPNGSGKTTTVRILATLLTPTSGTARVLGHDVVREAAKVRRDIGLVLGGDRGFYGRLSGHDNLRYFAALNQLAPAVARQRIDTVLGMVGMAGRASTVVEQYSRGMKQRLHIARGLLNDPLVVFLDEPTIGIDPVGAQELRDLVPQLTAQGKTVLLTTHYMFEADQLCDTVAIINKGSLVALGAPRDIRQRFSRVGVVELTLSAPRRGLADDLRRLQGVERVTVSADGPFERLTVYTPPDAAFAGCVRAAAGETGVVSVVAREPTLEEAYISLLR